MGQNGSATKAEVNQLADGLQAFVESLEFPPKRKDLAEAIGISDPVLSFIINRSDKKISRLHTAKIEAFLQQKGILRPS